MDNTIALILAAGEGKRMKSKKSKVVHHASGKPLVKWVSDEARKAGLSEQIVIVGHLASQVKEVLNDSYKFATQEKLLGTGHAVMQASEYLNNRDGKVFILCGDTPLITSQTIHNTIEFHDNNKNIATVITAELEDPTGYGRVVRENNGDVRKIVECKDADVQTKGITEINSGMYCFEIKYLLESLKELKNNNSQGEYYLTDTLEILISKGHKVGAHKIKDSKEILGINDRIQLSEASNLLKDRIIQKHMKNGVTIIDPASTYIDSDVMIGMDTIIYPMTILEGTTSIGENCILGPGTRIVDTEIADDVEVNNSCIYKSFVDSNTHVGPFAYIRPDSSIGKNVKIGDFVEIKKSTIGDNTKISHLTYVGDAEIGQNVNLGCGVVVVNYDGKNKNKTKVCDNSFVGCNVNLISPVVVEKGAYIAAGSTITENVPEEALAIARCRQTVKEDWVKNRFPKRS